MNFKSILAAGTFAIVAATATIGAASTAQAGTKVQITIGGGYYDESPVYYTPVCQWWEDCGVDSGIHFIEPGHSRRERILERRERYQERHREIETSRVSCRQALRMISRRGFHDVRSRDCEGTSYRFVGWKNGHQYMVKVNARTGGFNAYPL
jgi:hypothetical protein